MNKDFMNWLASDTPSAFFLQGRYGISVVVKVEKNDDFYYLFCQENSKEERLSQYHRFEYAGLYCKKDGRIYDGKDALVKIEENTETLEPTTAKALKEQLQQSVREKVEAAVGNDRKNLKVSKLTSGRLIGKMEDINNYGAAGEARRMFLETDEFSPLVFQCSYEPENWTEESLMAYILNPDDYAKKEAQSFMEDHQEGMLFNFLKNDALTKEYEAILENANNPVHIIKKIMSVMKASPARTVNVTIVKDGVEFTFKTEADWLRRDCGAYYHAWNIASADRKKFIKLFGCTADYYPQEIRRITYSKKVLYEA